MLHQPRMAQPKKNRRYSRQHRTPRRRLGVPTLDNNQRSK